MAFREVELSDEERAAAGARFKKFEAIGDRIAGLFVKQEERDGRFGRETVYTFRTKSEAGLIEDVSLSSGGHTDADMKLKKAALKQGNKVIVAFTGTRDVGKTNPMKLFKVQVDDSVTPLPPLAAPKPANPKPADDIPF